MTTYSEYLDWSGLHPGDPVPGHVSDIRAVARRFDEVAETIRAAVTALNNAGDTAQAISDAVRTQQDRVNEAKDNLSKVDERYATTASELRAYADKLDDWQVSAGTLHGQGRDAEQAVSTAQGNVNWADQCSFQALTSLNNASDDDPFKLNALKTSSDNAKSDYNKACTALSDARDNLEAIKKQLVDLHEKWDNGSEQTARNIRDGADADGQNNSFGSWLSNGWEGFCKWAEAAAQIVHQIAGAIAAVAGVLALVFAWVPVLGQILAVVALVAGVVDLLAQLVNYTNGHASFGDVVLAAFGVVAGGIAKGIGGVLKVANKAVSAAGTAASKVDDVAAAASKTSDAVEGAANAASKTDDAVIAGREATSAATTSTDVAAAQARITNPGSIFREGFSKPFEDGWQAIRHPKTTWADGWKDLNHWTDFTPWVRAIKGNASPMTNPAFEGYSLAQQFVGSQGLAIQVAKTGIDAARMPFFTAPAAYNATVGTWTGGSDYWVSQASVPENRLHATYS